MKVCSNTTPFIALASINRLDILPSLFGEIHVAQAVVDECLAGGRILLPSLQTLSWIMSHPDEPKPNLPVLFELDRGEQQTIALAQKHPGTQLIIDERMGRRVAEYLGLRVTGTLGVLAKAKQSGLIPSFSQAAHAMREQGIRFDPRLITRLAQHLGEHPHKNT